MAKIRSIKMEFWHDEKIGSLPPSKRLYTYEEMCDEIPSRARQEDFTMVEIGGRKLWQKRATA